MEIVQSAEDTGGIIGSPIKYKGAGMTPLTALLHARSDCKQSSWSIVAFVFFAEKTPPEPDLPSSTSSPTASAPFETSQFDSKPGPSQRPDSSEFQLQQGFLCYIFQILHQIIGGG